MKSTIKMAGAGWTALLVLLLVGTGCSVHHEALYNNMRRVLAEDEAIATINDLFLCTDRKDWQCVKELFAPQVIFDMTSLSGGQPLTLTGEQIASAWEKGLRNLAAVHHQTGNYQVAIRGKEAEVFCYGIAYHYLPNPTEWNTRTFVGSYNMHLVHSDAGWKIDRFKFNLKFIDGNKDLEGSARKPS